jgi:hypothetical protein
MDNNDEYECVMCGNDDTKCIEYTIIDRHGTISRDFACKKCANEMGLKTDEETDRLNRIYWRLHLKLQLGREITDEEFEILYNNRFNNPNNNISNQINI